MKERIVWPVLILLAVAVALGGATAAPADAKKDILGRWDHSKTDNVYIRFNKDGSFRWVTLKDEIAGGYRFLDGGVIELTTVIPRVGRKATEFKFRLKDDTLEIKIGDEWHRYSRAK